MGLLAMINHPSDFSTILKALKHGKTARRLSWEEGLYIGAFVPLPGDRRKKSYIYMDTPLSVGSRMAWTPSQDELFAHDWEVEETK